MTPEKKFFLWIYIKFIILICNQSYFSVLKILKSWINKKQGEEKYILDATW